MAAQTVDRVAASLGVDAPCRTADEELPGPAHGRSYWLGDRFAAHEATGGGDAELLCECEMVTRTRLAAALDERGDSSLDDLRRTTRLGMGPCQGAFCMIRATALLATRRAAGELPPGAPDPKRPCSSSSPSGHAGRGGSRGATSSPSWRSCRHLPRHPRRRRAA